MKYDVIEAFVAGLLSAPMRILLGIVTMVSMLAICVVVANVNLEWYEAPISWGEALFVFIVMIFVYWNNFGGWILLGLLCFVLQWAALYAFVVSDDVKAWWFLLMALSLACYFPVALSGPYWIILVGFLLLTAVYWLLPLYCRRLARKRFDG